MRLLHYTTEDCAHSIQYRGLDPTKSRGKEACVWLVEEFAAWRLVRHLEALRGVPTGGWVVFVVNVPDAWLVRSAIPGRYKCYQKIPAILCHSHRLKLRRKTDRCKGRAKLLPFVRRHKGHTGPPAA